MVEYTRKRKFKNSGGGKKMRLIKQRRNFIVSRENMNNKVSTFQSNLKNYFNYILIRKEAKNQ